MCFFRLASDRTKCYVLQAPVALTFSLPQQNEDVRSNNATGKLKIRRYLYARSCSCSLQKHWKLGFYVMYFSKGDTIRITPEIKTKIVQTCIQTLRYIYYLKQYIHVMFILYTIKWKPSKFSSATKLYIVEYFLLLSFILRCYFYIILLCFKKRLEGAWKLWKFGRERKWFLEFVWLMHFVVCCIKITNA